jgi:hypothetical protein
VQRQLLAAQRRRHLARLSAKRGATVITLIHRQETFSLLGLPLVRHIDTDDAESVPPGLPPGRERPRPKPQPARSGRESA